MTKKEIIVDYLKNYTEDLSIISLWNQRCDECIYPDDIIYTNDEDFLNNFFNDADSAVRATYYGDYRYGDDYVRFNGYGNLVSFQYATDSESPIDLDELADYIIEHPDDCENYIDFDDVKETCLYNLMDTYEVEDREGFEEWVDDNDIDLIETDWKDIFCDYCEFLNENNN